MPVIRQTSTRKASLSEVADYLRQGYQFPLYRAGDLVFVVDKDLPTIHARPVLITAVHQFDEGKASCTYDVRYSDDDGWIHGECAIPEHAIDHLLKPSPADAVAQAVLGDAETPEISPLSWLLSMVNSSDQPAVAAVANALEDDPDPEAYDQMIHEVRKLHDNLREVLGLEPNCSHMHMR